MGKLTLATGGGGFVMIITSQEMARYKRYTHGYLAFTHRSQKDCSITVNHCSLLKTMPEGMAQLCSPFKGIPFFNLEKDHPRRSSLL